MRKNPKNTAFHNKVLRGLLQAFPSNPPHTGPNGLPFGSSYPWYSRYEWDHNGSYLSQDTEFRLPGGLYLPAFGTALGEHPEVGTLDIKKFNRDLKRLVSGARSNTIDWGWHLSLQIPTQTSTTAVENLLGITGVFESPVRDRGLSTYRVPLPDPDSGAFKVVLGILRKIPENSSPFWTTAGDPRRSGYWEAIQEALRGLFKLKEGELLNSP